MKKFLFLLSILLSGTVLSQNANLLPSEAIALMYKAVNENPDRKRIENTKPYQERVITTGLDAKEKFYLGETYFWNFMPKEAKAAYTELLNDGSVLGNAARQRIWVINVNGFGLHDEVEKDVQDYQKTVKSTVDDRFGAFSGVNFVTARYKREGEHQKVVDMINTELDRLSFKGAYRSFLLPIRSFESYQQVGAADKIAKRMAKIRDGLKTTLKDRKENAPEKDFMHTQYCSSVQGMLTAVTEKLGYEQINKEFEDIITQIDEFVSSR